MFKTPSAPKRRGRKQAAAKTTTDADTMNSTRSSSRRSKAVDNDVSAETQTAVETLNSTRSSSRRSKAVDNDVSAETQTAVETLNSTRSSRSSRAASRVRQSL